MLLSRWRYYLRSIPTLLWNIAPRLRMIAVFLGVRCHAPFGIVLRGGLHFMVRDALDIWIIKESCLDRVYDCGGSSLHTARVIIDIGAGIGDFSVHAARLSKHSVVYAYEPDPGSFALLQHNIALNGCGNIIAYPQVVGGQSTLVSINRDFTSPVLYQTAAASAGDSAEPPIVSLSLDDIFAVNGINCCDLLKIDCEGAEYNILFQTSAVTLAAIRAIAMEYHDDMIPWRHQSLVALLERHGFCVQCVPSPAHREIGFLYAKRPPTK